MVIMGKARGAILELLEAAEVLNGKGPPALTKFILEVGTDLLFLAKKIQQWKS
jgi:thymidine phosphorylase